MKLVGATDAFVGAPFLLEGVLQGLARRRAGRGRAGRRHLGAPAAAAARRCRSPPGSPRPTSLPGRAARRAARRRRGARAASPARSRCGASCGGRAGDGGRAARARPRRRPAGAPLRAGGAEGRRARGGPRAGRPGAVGARHAGGRWSAPGATPRPGPASPRRSGLARPSGSTARSGTRTPPLARHRALVARLRPRLAALQLMARVGELPPARLRADAWRDLVKRRALLGKVLEGDAALAPGGARRRSSSRSGSPPAAQAEAARLAALAAEAGARRAEASSRRDGFRATAGGGARASGSSTSGPPPRRRPRAASWPTSSRRCRPRAPGRRRTAASPRCGASLPRPAGGPHRRRLRQGGRTRASTPSPCRTASTSRRQRGEAVLAVAPGRVVHAGWFKGYGNLVIVDHGDGYHTLVAHLATHDAPPRARRWRPAPCSARWATPARSRGPTCTSRCARTGSRSTRGLAQALTGRSPDPARRRGYDPRMRRSLRPPRPPGRARPGACSRRDAPRPRPAATPPSPTARSTSSPTCSPTSRTATSRRRSEKELVYGGRRGDGRAARPALDAPAPGRLPGHARRDHRRVRRAWGSR